MDAVITIQLSVPVLYTSRTDFKTPQFFICGYPAESGENYARFFLNNLTWWNRLIEPAAGLFELKKIRICVILRNDFLLEYCRYTDIWLFHVDNHDADD